MGGTKMGQPSPGHQTGPQNHMGQGRGEGGSKPFPLAQLLALAQPLQKLPQLRNPRLWQGMGQERLLKLLGHLPQLVGLIPIQAEARVGEIREQGQTPINLF